MVKENKKFNVLMIYGSPRRSGNTDELLNSFEKGLLENKRYNKEMLFIDKVIVNNLKIMPCIECRKCSIDGQCAIKDDMQDIYPKLINYDFIAVASPIFFTSVSGFLKGFIDRCQRFWALKYELKENIFNKKRKGIFISTAGSNNSNIFDCSKKVIKSFFDVLYVDYDASFTYNSIDFKGDILKNEEMMLQLYDYGKNIVF